jgi:starch synthase
MYIVTLASEMAPVAKAGGLGDVLQGLSRELILQGNRVEIFIPYYDCLKKEKIHDLKLLDGEFYTDWDGGKIKTRLYYGWVDHIKVFFLDFDDPKNYFKRGVLYGQPDDPERFSLFAKGCLEYLKISGEEPDIFHIHDWQTSIIAPLLKFQYKNFQKSRTILTIHNLSYQGQFNADLLEKLELPLDVLLTPQALQDPRHWELVNLLKGGIIFSDYVTTVSPTYAKEILTWEYGEGLVDTLKHNLHKLKGVLNGLDYHFWNPETDPNIPRNYTLDDLKGKKAAKKTLCEVLNLESTDLPICAVVSRLVPQKGIDLMQKALFRTLEAGGQFVLLGTSPIDEITSQFLDIQQKHDGNRRLSLTIEYREELAHLIYAGTDLLLVPSLFEPCGLSQLIALRYGSIPVVRSTGGLADTVKDVDNENAPERLRNGYSFNDPTTASLYGALDRALHCWFEDKKKWNNTQKRGMLLDFSWKHSAQEYMMIYQQMLES